MVRTTITSAICRLVSATTTVLFFRGREGCGGETSARGRGCFFSVAPGVRVETLLGGTAWHHFLLDLGVESRCSQLGFWFGPRGVLSFPSGLYRCERRPCQFSQVVWDRQTVGVQSDQSNVEPCVLHHCWFLAEPNHPTKLQDMKEKGVNKQKMFFVGVVFLEALRHILCVCEF